MFFYHEGLKAEKDPNHRIIEPQADDMRRKISNYGDYYLPPRGDSLDLRTRVRDHIYAIDNEFSMENDPSYRYIRKWRCLLILYLKGYFAAKRRNQN